MSLNVSNLFSLNFLNMILEIEFGTLNKLWSNNSSIIETWKDKGLVEKPKFY